jgi:hypothetical protein
MKDLGEAGRRVLTIPQQSGNSTFAPRESVQDVLRALLAKADDAAVVARVAELLKALDEDALSRR